MTDDELRELLIVRRELAESRGEVERLRAVVARIERYTAAIWYAGAGPSGKAEEIVRTIRGACGDVRDLLPHDTQEAPHESTSPPREHPAVDIAREALGYLSVRCRSCGAFFEQRENLLTGQWLWFANCKCPVTKDSAEVLEAPHEST